MSGRIPNIPKELYEPRFGYTLLLIAYACLLFFGFGALSFWLFQADMPLFIKILFLIVTGLGSGQGLHLLGNMGHEGFHFTLHKNKDVSAKIGIFCSAATIFHHDVGFSYSHWNHHNFTNTEKDPDTQIFTKFKNGISRAIFARVEAIKFYAKDTFCLAFNRPLGYKVAFPMALERVRKYARFNYLAVSCWLAIYGFIYWLSPLYAVILVSCSFIALNVIASLRPYFEHAGLGFKRLERTRTYVHPFWTIFYCNINYHLEHHLFPSVPFFNLAKVHALMQENKIYEGTGVKVIETGLWDPLKISLLGMYPDPKQMPSEENPAPAKEQ